MCFQPLRIVGIALQIIPIRQSVAEQDMHHRTGKSAVGTGFQDNPHIRLPHGCIGIDVDGDDLRAALLAGAHCMGHDIDLRGSGIGAPDHHTIGLCHFARVRPRQAARSGKITCQAVLVQ